jgi:ferredoxin-NADP reductase
VANMLGFSSARSLNRALAKAVRKSPSELRNAVPRHRLERQKAVVASVAMVSGNIMKLELALGPDVTFRFEAGQSIALLVDLEGKYELRLYALASAPAPEGVNTFSIYARLRSGGRVSSRLAQLIPGDSLLVSGPFGLFTVRRPLAESLMFIGFGLGIVPIRSMLQYLLCDRSVFLNSTRHCRVIHVVTSAEDLIYCRDFEEISSRDSRICFCPLVAGTEQDLFALEADVLDMVGRFCLECSVHVYLAGPHAEIDRIRSSINAAPFSSKASVIS